MEVPAILCNCSATSALLHLNFWVVDLAKDPLCHRIFSKIHYVLLLKS